MFFQFFDFNGKFTPPHSHWVMKGSIFDILGMFFFHFLLLNELLSHIENIYQFFEFIVTILLTCNAIYQYDRKNIYHLSMIPL